VDNDTNDHLQNALLLRSMIWKTCFTFAVVELCNSSVLLQREQYYLDILFSLPANLRYNFNPTAGSSLGYKHTEDARAKISDSMTGANNSMYGRTGALNPMYGKS